MAQHTPAPWILKPSHVAGENICVVMCTQADRDAGYTTIAAPAWDHSRDFYEQNAANARLIAAAPDLLAALRRLLATVNPGNAADHDDGCRCVIHEARVAIAKAGAQS